MSTQYADVNPSTGTGDSSGFVPFPRAVTPKINACHADEPHLGHDLTDPSTSPSPWQRPVSVTWGRKRGSLQHATATISTDSVNDSVTASEEKGKRKSLGSISWWVRCLKNSDYLYPTVTANGTHPTKSKNLLVGGCWGDNISSVY